MPEITDDSPVTYSPELKIPDPVTQISSTK
jgi:hypothetical protein